MKSLEKITLVLFLLLLPSQLTLHFWPSWSFVSGLPVDYLSPTIYLTDLLALYLIIPKIRSIKISHIFTLPLIVLISLAVLNIVFSLSPFVTLYKWLRVLEYLGMLAYFLNLKFSPQRVLTILSCSLIWTSTLAWLQFVQQRSLGGLWWFLGERPLTSVMPAVAKIPSVFLPQLLRPYATFPHPNALAGFLLVSLVFLFYFDTQKNNPSKIALILALLTIPITFSRVAILLEILFLLTILVRKYYLLLIPLVSILLIPGSSASIPERIFLQHKSIVLLVTHPLFGVGLGNFINQSTITSGLFTLNLQPVHNIFLLISTELGIPFVYIVSYFLMQNIIKLKTFNSSRKKSLITLIIIIIITGSLDHYWLTSHQNILLLCVTLPLLIINQKPHDIRSKS